jgi:AbiV family abortive infection protein
MSIQIPLEEVPQGIDLSVSLGLRHLDDAKMLIKSERVEGATILAVFGLEELGRIIILKDKYKKASAKGDIYIEIKDRKQDGKKDAFYDHIEKQKIAKDTLPPNSLELHKGCFGEDFGKGFDIDIYLDQGLREITSYLDFCYKWQTPNPIDVDKLKNCINEIEKAIKVQAII